MLHFALIDNFFVGYFLAHEPGEGTKMKPYAPRKKGQVSGAQPSAPNASFERTPLAKARGYAPLDSLHFRLGKIFYSVESVADRLAYAQAACGGVAQLESR